MVGMLVWSAPRKGTREKAVRLRERSILHMRVCCAEILRGPKTPEAVLRRRVREAARRLRKAGVSRVALPEEFPYGAMLDACGLQQVSTLPLRRAVAADWVRRSLRERGVSAAQARVAVVAESLTGEVVRTVTELALRHRYVLLSVPFGGEELSHRLRREYGVSLLLSPTREQLAGADAALLFAAYPALTGGQVLPLYDEAAPLPPLGLPPVLEDALTPGIVRAQLLTLLLESGVLRPGQIVFQGEET